MAAHRAAAAADGRGLDELVEAADRCPPCRDWEAALRVPGLSVIAEVKRRSPSAGDLAPSLDPVALAAAYVSGGAACLSVLTDQEFFGGSVADLEAARGAVPVPVLRKDFTVDERDVADARLMGADAVLLIVAGLSDEELTRFGALAAGLGLAALYEVHDRGELERAVGAGARIIGVNQRDLHTFEIDRSLAEALRPFLPDDVVAVAESGVRDATDAHRLAAAGYDAVLVGSSLVTADGPSAAVAALVSAGQE